MTCRDAKSGLALLVGGDLDDAVQRRELREHLAQCRSCRAHYRSLKSAFAVLSGLPAAGTWDSTSSVWPSVQKSLDRPAGPTLVEKSVQTVKHWSPLAVMIAACVVVLVTLGGDQGGAPVSERGVLSVSPTVSPEEPAPTSSLLQAGDDDAEEPAEPRDRSSP